MRKLIALTVVIILSATNAFAGAVSLPVTVTNIPTLSEWGVFGAVVVLGLVGVFFLVKRRKRGCCG